MFVENAKVSTFKGESFVRKVQFERESVAVAVNLSVRTDDHVDASRDAPANETGVELRRQRGGTERYHVVRHRREAWAHANACVRERHPSRRGRHVWNGTTAFVSFNAWLGGAVVCVAKASKFLDEARETITPCVAKCKFCIPGSETIGGNGTTQAECPNVLVRGRTGWRLRIDEKDQEQVKSDWMPGGLDTPGFGSPPLRWLEAFNNAPSGVAESLFDGNVVHGISWTVRTNAPSWQRGIAP